MECILVVVTWVEFWISLMGLYREYIMEEHILLVYDSGECPEGALQEGLLHFFIPASSEVAKLAKTLDGIWVNISGKEEEECTLALLSNWAYCQSRDIEDYTMDDYDDYKDQVASIVPYFVKSNTFPPIPISAIYHCGFAI
jgi:hypothetical protein